MKTRKQINLEFLMKYNNLTEDFKDFFHECDKIPAKVLNKRIQNVTGRKSTVTWKTHLIRDGFIEYEKKTRSYVNLYYLLYGSTNDENAILNAEILTNDISRSKIVRSAGDSLRKRRTTPRPEQSEFRKQVLERADYKCIICEKDEDLEAHHMESYKFNPYLRADPDNGVCLCYYCHKLFHKEYGTYNNTIEQFNEFYSNYRM